MNLVSKETSIAGAVVASKISKCFTWFSKSSARQATAQTAQKTSQTAGKCLSSGNIQKQYVNLASPKRTQHILYGDRTGGGHLFPAKPNKSEFPRLWSGDKTMHNISDIATDPNISWNFSRGKMGSAITNRGHPTRCFAIGEREGIKIKVVIEPYHEGIISAYTNF